MHEKKYYEKGELLPLTGNSLDKLEKALQELEKLRIIQTDGWLVKLIEPMRLHEVIGEETAKSNNKNKME